MTSDLETNIVSVERIIEYTETETEVNDFSFCKILFQEQSHL